MEKHGSKKPFFVTFLVPSVSFKNSIKSVLNLAHQRDLTRARVLFRKVGGI